MIAFLKFLFFFFLSLMILGIISRFLLKIWLRKVFKRMNQNTGNNYQERGYSRNNPEPKKKIINRNEGDYVDYEDVK